VLKLDATIFRSPLPFRHVSTFLEVAQNDSVAAYGSAGVVLLGLYDGSKSPAVPREYGLQTEVNN
jgi:hypothetical protein